MDESFIEIKKDGFLLYKISYVEIRITGIVFWNGDGLSLSSSSSREYLVNKVELFGALVDVGVPTLLEATLILLVAKSLKERSLISSILKHCTVKLECDSCFVLGDCSDRCEVSVASLGLLSVVG